MVTVWEINIFLKLNPQSSRRLSSIGIISELKIIVNSMGT
jgi:hypothetical protein